MDANPSSSHRSRLPFSIVSVYSANPKAPNVATWHLCGPFFGGDEASAQVRSSAPPRPAPGAPRVADGACVFAQETLLLEELASVRVQNQLRADQIAALQAALADATAKAPSPSTPRGRAENPA